jgi:glycosyltransferase involved in cell wall biosynthesis
VSDAKPLVSVLINNYNYGRFLRDSIDSALNQTYPNTEVIVVDDGSTDDSREIIESYDDRIIPVLKENGGHGSTFNAGFAVSRGGLVCYLDADDVWLPTKVERVVEAALAYPDAVFIYHRVQPASADLRPIHKVFPTMLLHGDISGRVRRAGGWWACAPTSAQCLTRSVLERIGPLPEAELRTAPDAFFQYLLPFLGPVVGINEPLMLYRRHGANDSGTVAFREKTPDRKAFIAHLERYERLVNAANTRLGELRVGARLQMEDHWGYQFLRYRTGLPGHRSRVRLAWRALKFAGLPSAVDRLKVAVRTMVQAPLPNRG